MAVLPLVVLSASPAALPAQVVAPTGAVAPALQDPPGVDGDSVRWWYTPGHTQSVDRYAATESQPDGLPLQARRAFRDPRRGPFIGWGMVIGGVAGAVYCFHAAREGALGYVGGFFAAPLFIPAGMIAGMAVGLGVSLIFVH